MNANESTPIILYIKETEKDLYERLRNSSDSPLYGFSRKKIFMLAMSIGLVEGIYSTLEGSKKETYVRAEYLDNQDKAIIDAVAIAHDGNLDVIRDQKKVFSIAEGYASGGIRSLIDRVFSGEYGSFIKRLESELRSELDKWMESFEQTEA